MENILKNLTNKKLTILVLLFSLFANSIILTGGLSNNYFNAVESPKVSVLNTSDINPERSVAATDINIMAVAGRKSWGSFTGDVVSELAAFAPAGKYWRIYNTVHLIITKGWQAYSKDWIGLAWTVVDAVSAFIPGATAAKLFWSISKLTPSF